VKAKNTLGRSKEPLGIVRMYAILFIIVHHDDV
jgi:hypothetical protein